MSKYRFEFDLSVSIKDVLDADDGKVEVDIDNFNDSNINISSYTIEEDHKL